MKNTIGFIILFVFYSTCINLLDTNPRDHIGMIWAIALILCNQALPVKPKDNEKHRDGQN